MATSQRRKGSYHEKWWCKWFEDKGCAAKRQPLSGQLGGEHGGDIKIQSKVGGLVAESKYQTEGRGFSFLTKTHNEQQADIYLLKQKKGPSFIVMEANSSLAERFVRWLGRGV